MTKKVDTKPEEKKIEETVPETEETTAATDATEPEVESQEPEKKEGPCEY